MLDFKKQNKKSLALWKQSIKLKTLAQHCMYNIIKKTAFENVSFFSSFDTRYQGMCVFEKDYGKKNTIISFDVVWHKGGVQSFLLNQFTLKAFNLVVSTYSFYKILRTIQETCA